MRSDKSLTVLLDIRDNIHLAQKFVATLDERAFSEDIRTFYAVTRCIEIISEACRRLDPAIRERHSDQPWRKILDAGNFYRHNYDNVAEKFVWKTVKDSLPSLLQVVEEELHRIKS